MLQKGARMDIMLHANYWEKSNPRDIGMDVTRNQVTYHV